MEKIPDNSEKTQILDRENEVLDLIKKGVTPILPFELEALQSIIQNPDHLENEVNDAIDFVKKSCVVEYPNPSVETITIGSRVTSEYTYMDGTKQTITYIITGNKYGKYNDTPTTQFNSPIGNLLLGAKEGDDVRLAIGSDKDQYVLVKIIKIDQISQP